MSRHLLIRCDHADCPERIETRASDTNPTSIEVPGDWLTLRQAGQSDRHYCSMPCLLAANATVTLPAAAQEVRVSPSPPVGSPYATPSSVAAESVKSPTAARRKKM